MKATWFNFIPLPTFSLAFKFNRVSFSWPFLHNYPLKHKEGSSKFYYHLETHCLSKSEIESKEEIETEEIKVEQPI
jgi:hypothetical protein